MKWRGREQSTNIVDNRNQLYITFEYTYTYTDEHVGPKVVATSPSGKVFAGRILDYNGKMVTTKAILDYLKGDGAALTSSNQYILIRGGINADSKTMTVFSDDPGYLTDEQEAFLRNYFTQLKTWVKPPRQIIIGCSDGALKEKLVSMLNEVN